MKKREICLRCGEVEIDSASNTLWCADCLALEQEEYRQEYETRIAELEARETDADESYAGYLHHAIRGLRAMQIPGYGHD